MTRKEELIKASKNGNLQKIKDLVNQGADIHIRNEEALRWAANNGYLDIVKYLVSQGADIHAKNDEALRYAISNGYQDVVEYLKNYEKPKEIFNLKALNTDGRTTCARCGSKLNMPINMDNNYNYCPTCED